MVNKKTSILIILPLLLFTLFVLVPFLNMLAITFSSPDNVASMSGLAILPKGFTLINYQVILSNPAILRSLMVTITITITATILNVLFTAILAYILIQKNLMFRRFFIVITIIIMIVEPSIVQDYLLITKLNLQNNLLALVLIKVVNIYYLFILMRFFETIPSEIIDSAKIDGANHIQIFKKIYLPMSISILSTLALFYAVFHWNEYFKSSIYINDSNLWPLQVLLRQLTIVNDTSALVGLNNILSYSKTAQLNYKSLQATIVIISLVPLLLIYPLVLKTYVKGSLEGGVK
ncbi:MAG: carbohydrate ABC transporter permease [Bacilli bacterium]